MLLLVVGVWVDGGCDVFDAFILEGLDVVLFGVIGLDVELLRVVWFGVILLLLLLLLLESWHTHPGIPKAVEDVDAAWTHAGRRLREGLQHGSHETGEDIVDLGDEEGAEAGVAVAEGGEEEEELVEVVRRGRCEGVRGWRGYGEDVGEGVGYVEEFLDLGGWVSEGSGFDEVETYQCYTVNIHRMWRETCGHGDEVS